MELIQQMKIYVQCQKDKTPDPMSEHMGRRSFQKVLGGF